MHSVPGPRREWLAAQSGPQTIPTILDKAIQVHRCIWSSSSFQASRIQEFLPRWSPDHGRSYWGIVRQQYNFNPPGTASEVEDYEVDLSALTPHDDSCPPDQVKK